MHPLTAIAFLITVVAASVAADRILAVSQRVHGPRVDNNRIEDFNHIEDDRANRLWLTAPIRDRCRARLAAAPDKKGKHNPSFTQAHRLASVPGTTGSAAPTAHRSATTLDIHHMNGTPIEVGLSMVRGRTHDYLLNTCCNLI